MLFLVYLTQSKRGQNSTRVDFHLWRWRGKEILFRTDYISDMNNVVIYLIIICWILLRTGWQFIMRTKQHAVNLSSPFRILLEISLNIALFVCTSHYYIFLNVIKLLPNTRINITLNNIKLLMFFFNTNNELHDSSKSSFFTYQVQVPSHLSYILLTIYGAHRIGTQMCQLFI